ncbi:VENN motif pre-toxin domain-containing protein [Streptomyces microflavus]|uniref:VENN motif pre-toxin domain-containing protein n=1 Tax=Streptomyces microflavus TaxID=1919 RepID=UPI00389ADDE7
MVRHGGAKVALVVALQWEPRSMLITVASIAAGLAAGIIGGSRLRDSRHSLPAHSVTS